MASKNPVVFLELQVGKRPLGRLLLELFADTTPRTAENFRSLCTGERGASVSSRQRLSLQGSPFHRVIAGFMAQGGDITRGDGTGGESIFGEKFADENFLRTHDKAGLLSMANSGPNTNGSQFFITFRDTPHLNGRHVVFGQVIEGMDLVKVLENVSTDGSDRPRAPVIISQCGQIGQELPPEEEAKTSASIAGDSEENTAGTNEREEEQIQSKEEDKEEEEEEAPTEEQLQQQMAGMTPAQQRLFKLRLRINQGRKLNQAETEKEYKRNNDPAYAKRERAAERQLRQKESGEENYVASSKGNDTELTLTAAECEQKMMKKDAKDRNRASFGWEAFSKEAGYRAYSKRLAKLPGSDSNNDNGSDNSSNPLNYGKSGTEVSNNGLNRMVNEINRQEESRLNYSRRRTAHEATTVDHISDKNEFFNKKLKRSFDKYTVEIRQNLERGTAL